MFVRVMLVFIAVFVGGQPAFADTVIPDRRLSVTRDIDFYGSDLTNIFDTTYKACERACLADQNCQAFTFNTKSLACFPKSAVTKSEPYEGAISARVIDASAEAIGRASVRSLDLGFLRQADLKSALTQAQTLSDRYVAGEFSVQAYIDAATRDRNAGKPDAARRFIGAALTLSDQADLWDQLARDAYEAARQSSKSKQRLNQLGLSASVNAYLRSENPAQQVNALSLIARGLEANRRGKDMIAPLRLAQTLSPRDDVSKALDRAIRLYGFNLAETTVESNTLDPRICSEFSESLDKTVDYASYVQTQVPGISIEASGSSLCIAGLTHGQRYNFTFRQGLPAASGEQLQKSIEVTQYVRDRQPNVRFPDRAYVLPAVDSAALPVVATNTDTLDLTLYRVGDRNILRTMQDGYFGRPLSQYQRSEFAREVANEIWSGTGQVETALNQDVTTRLPVGEIVGDLKPGVYVLQAAIPGGTGQSAPATQWFVISDLGVSTMTGTDGLHVFVRGLSDALPREGTEVSLLSRANTVLGTALTNAEGYAKFDPGLSLGKGGDRPGLVTLQNGDDFAFLSLTDPEFDLSDRGVEGRPASPPIDVFLTTERGAYRAGEVIHALALARDGSADAIKGLGLTAILTRPDGVEYSRVTLQDQGAGGRVFALPLSGSVPRGTWRVAIYADVEAAALASTKLLVEDFLPERIDVELSMPDGPIKLGQTPPQLSVQADYLFGAPGADLGVEGDVILRAATEVDGFSGFSFGRHDQQFRAKRGQLQGGVKTDATGAALLTLDLPELTEVMQPLEARIIARVREGSNRPVERVLTKKVVTNTPLIGIRSQSDGVVPENTEAAFDLIAVSPDLARQSMRVKWTINRVRTRYQWYSNYGNWYWDPVTTRSRVATGEAQLTPDQITTVAAPVEWGQYEIKVERLDGSYVASSASFYAGWYASADASATPDLLEASLDQASYRPGDTATFRVVPRAAGTALVTVMSNRLVAMKTVEVSEGENLIDLPVTDEWGAGVYVSATVIRPLDAATGQNPTRALGLSYAPVDPGDHLLRASFDMPTEVAPRGPLNVALQVDGVAEGETAYAMIAAVDQGILNLTGFKPPSATDHYFGQRKLGMGIRDIYGRLIDGQTGALGTIRSGGGNGDAGLSSQSPPPTEELVAYVSGPVTIGSDGVARTTFTLPEFNGSVRLMAVVWSGGAVGEATAEVLVRDPVVVTATLPRFMAPGDQSQLLLEIIHATGPVGEMPLTVTATGATLGAVPTSVTLSEQGKQVIAVPINAMKTGSASVRVTLRTPDGHALRKTLNLPIQRNDPVIQRRSQFSLAAGSTFTLDGNAFDGFLPGTASATLAAGPLARFDAPGLLQALDRYPYGCTEQTTSRALPLLYLDQVASAMKLDERQNIATRIEQAIDRVLTNQASNGAFGLWRPGRGDMWLDAYVTDFLSRAQAQGHTVPKLAMRQALDNLRNQVNRARDFEEGGEGLAYALLVLAREGAASIGDLRYYADVKADAFGTPMALAQVGAALAAYGDPTRADKMFRLAGARLEAVTSEGQKWRADYGTHLRDAAAVLTLAVEAGSNAINVERISSQVAPSLGEVTGRSTQESVWSLLAANALLNRSDGTLSLNGTPVQGPLVQVLQQDATSPVAIQNTGQQDTVVTLSTFGVAARPEPQGGNGYRIDRAYYTMKGELADATEVQSGTRLVAVLTVQPFNKGEGRLMVNDPLPAGFEIDNPNLLRGGDVRALDWLKTSDRVRNTEFRQERFLAAVDHGGTKPFQLAYIVRAIAPGSYHHPAASVEDMYRPTYRARTDTGRIVVTK